MEAFVYRWRNTNTKKWYVGYHKGTPDDGYICSSRIAKPLIQGKPNEWVRKILRFGTKKEMFALERRILKGLNAKNNPNSLNRSNGGFNCPSFNDQMGFDFNKMSAHEIAIRYKEEIDAGDPQRILMCNIWILNKVCV